MVGHSKWSKVRHIKGPLDVKRGTAPGKQVKEITVAACFGVDDPAGETRRRSVVKTARARNLLKQNVERAIQKGMDEMEGMPDEETIDHGDTPGGEATAIAATDYKNRSAADPRFIFSKNHGNPAFDDDFPPVYSHFDPSEEILARLSA